MLLAVLQQRAGCQLHKDDSYVATVGGVTPSVDHGSLDPKVIGATRPQGSENRDAENAAYYREVLNSAAVLRRPLRVKEINPRKLGECSTTFEYIRSS